MGQMTRRVPGVYNSPRFRSARVFLAYFKPQGTPQKAPVDFGRVSDSKKKRQKLICHICVTQMQNS